MEFKGNEFIRNIEIEKEKAELKRRSEALESEKNKSVIKDPSYYQETSDNSFDDEPVIVDIKEEPVQELNDILLNNNSNNDNKRKYIILSIALSILFILTIIIIRLVSDDKEQDKLFETPKIENIKQDEILSGTDSNEKYQELIDKKAKQTIQKKLDLDTIIQEEIPVPETKEKPPKTEPKKETTKDLFGMEKKQTATVKKSVEVEKEVVKTIQKPKEKISPKEIVTPIQSKPSKVSGTFVQIGAFTKQPNKALLNKIKKAGYKYIIHKMNIKGT